MSNVNTAQNQHLRSDAGAPGLRIRLLGPVGITIDGRSIPIASKKTRALLGYLVMREGSEVARNVLTGLLWGERSENQARASLRQALSELRGALVGAEAEPLAANNETIPWKKGSGWVDVRILGTATDSEDEHTLREASSLLTGELMEGLAIGEPGFEQWLASERERFRVMSGISAHWTESAE